MKNNHITGLILTFNEENILEKSLESLNFVDEVIVFDSYSTDNTIEIARSFNAKIIQRKFDNFSSQRNAALKSVNSDSKWILMIDADEIISEDLKQEISDVTKIENDISLYMFRRKDIYNDKWLRYSSGYPTWFPRLFRNGEVTVKREINEEYICKGDTANLNGHLIHYPFNKGLNWWISKHNKYSDMEAQLMLTEINEKIKISNLFSSSPILRRQVQKRLSYHIPFRPHFVFFAFYFLKRGFLDGRSGYQFCKLRKMYETMIDLKFKALKSKHES
tara:strand:+ start:413 stop:1240 length:828 start_codon:yes stop_codon:yes gene_type:complete